MRGCQLARWMIAMVAVACLLPSPALGQVARSPSGNACGLPRLTDQTHVAFAGIHRGTGSVFAVPNSDSHATS